MCSVMLKRHSIVAGKMPVNDMRKVGITGDKSLTDQGIQIQVNS